MDAPLPGRSYTRADLVGRGFAASLINDLEQPADPSQTWGTVRTLFWSVISLGLIPAIWWPIKFRRQVAAERNAINRLSDWIRAHSSHSESGLLRNAGDEITSAPILAIIPLLICGGLIYLAITIQDLHFHRPLIDLLSNTVWYRQSRSFHGFLPKFAEDYRNHKLSLFTAWNAGLSIAYLCHGIQLRAHRAMVARYLSRLNRVLVADGLSPVSIAPSRPPTGVFWILGIVCLWHLSAAWGIVAMLVGAGQYRYFTRNAPAVRAGLSKTIVEIGLRSALPSAVAARCPRERCRAVLRPGAHFCGRCGSVLQA